MALQRNRVDFSDLETLADKYKTLRKLENEMWDLRAKALSKEVLLRVRQGRTDFVLHDEEIATVRKILKQAGFTPPKALIK
jgi:hypothetical protein